ncbi:MAG: hypothetical protein LIO65_08605 [Odoribacter sp.]|nr:hypothetical protein [Odoribacter sp.]
MVRVILFIHILLALMGGKSYANVASLQDFTFIPDSLILSDDLPTLKDEAYSFIAKGKYAECEFASEKLLHYSSVENNPLFYTYALIYLGQSRIMLGKFDKAFEHLNEAEELAKLYKNDSALCFIYNGRGLYEYNVNSDEARALNYYIQGIKLADKCGHTLLYSILSANAALILTIKNDENSYRYARECYRMGHQNKDPYLIYCGAISMARYLYVNKRTDEALKYLKEAERLSLQNDFHNKSDSYNSYGEIALEEGNYNMVCKFFEAAIQEHGFSQSSYVVLTYLGYGRALFNLENYKEAIEKLQQGLIISLETGMPIYLRELYLLLSESYEKIGETSQALHFYKKYVAQQNALYNKDNEKTYRELLVKYETEKKENELIKKRYFT